MWPACCLCIWYIITTKQRPGWGLREDFEGDLSSSSVFPALAPKSFSCLSYPSRRRRRKTQRLIGWGRETQTMNLCTCTQTQPHPITHTNTNHRSHTHTFSLFLSGSRLASLLHKQNVAALTPERPIDLRSNKGSTGWQQKGDAHKQYFLERFWKSISFGLYRRWL